MNILKPNLVNLVQGSSRVDLLTHQIGYQWQWKCGCSLTLCPGHDVKLHPHFIVTGSFLYWCVMRPASQRFFINSCIYLRILILSYFLTFLGTNSFLCWCAVKQSINQNQIGWRSVEIWHRHVVLKTEWLCDFWSHFFLFFVFPHSINQSINQSINLSIYLSIYQYSNFIRRRYNNILSSAYTGRSSWSMCMLNGSKYMCRCLFRVWSIKIHF